MTTAVTNLVAALQQQLAVFTDLRQLLQEEQQGHCGSRYCPDGAAEQLEGAGGDASVQDR